MTLSSKKVLSIAWIGQGDFGDEVMAYVLRTYLSRAGLRDIVYYHHGKFPTYVGKIDMSIHTMYPFQLPSRIKNFFDVYRLRKIDVMLMGGGSIFHSYNSIAWKYSLYKKIKEHNPRAFVAGIGVSLGPFDSKDSQLLCGEFIQSMDILVTRDAYSAEIAAQISPASSSVVASCDTSFLLPNICQEKFTNRIQQKDDLVGMMFVKIKSTDDSFETKKHFEKYLAIINSTLQKGKRVKLFTLYVGDAYDDMELNKKLQAECERPEQVSVYEFTGDIFAMIDEIRQCSTILSMRLHGVIFAYMLGIPFVSLEYNRKNRNFCETVHYPLDMVCSDSEESYEKTVIAQLDRVFREGTSVFQNSMPVRDVTNMVEKNMIVLMNRLQDALKSGNTIT